MSSLAAHRRHPTSIVLVLLLGLVITGGLYALLAPSSAGAATGSGSDVKAGKQIFLANCATCHGVNGNGRANNPSLVGVGAAAVDFQVSTGRMPLAAPAVQAPRANNNNGIQFSSTEISQLAAYVASLGAGPAIPPSKYTSLGGNIAKGGQLFRVNCAMCHNFAGSGGALTEGKYAPSLMPATGRQIYEAMLTGPQSMPVFNDANLAPQDKKDIIAYVKNVKDESNQGGANLGNLGPVTEGMFAWTLGIGLLIGAAVWLGRKAA